MRGTLTAFSTSDVFPKTDDTVSADSSSHRKRDFALERSHCRHQTGGHVPPAPALLLPSPGHPAHPPAGILRASLGFGFRGGRPASGAMDPHLCSRITLSHHPATWFCRINFLRSSRDHPGCTRSSCVSHLKPPFLDPTPPSMRCLTSRTLINSCGHLVSLFFSPTCLPPCGCCLGTTGLQCRIRTWQGHPSAPQPHYA